MGCQEWGSEGAVLEFTQGMAGWNTCTYSHSWKVEIIKKRDLRVELSV